MQEALKEELGVRTVTAHHERHWWYCAKPFDSFVQADLATSVAPCKQGPQHQARVQGQPAGGRTSATQVGTTSKRGGPCKKVVSGLHGFDKRYTPLQPCFGALSRVGVCLEWKRRAVEIMVYS